MAINLRPWQNSAIEWDVWRPEYGETEDDAYKVMSRSAESAAEDYAEWEDSQGDYTIIRGTEAHVMVRRSGEAGAPECFEVRGETVAHYIARSASST